MPPLVLRPAATDVDWEIICGETLDLHLPVLDASGQPVTVTGWTARAQIRRSRTDPLLHEWSTARGNAACAGTEVVLQVIGSITAAWQWTDAQVQVQVTDPGGKPHTIAQGPIHAAPCLIQ